MDVQCCVCLGRGTTQLIDPIRKIHRCRVCTHAFTEGVTDSNEIYVEEYFDEEHKHWFNNPNTRLFRWIHGYIRRWAGEHPLRLLDVGCGRGDFLKYLQQVDPQIRLWGIDLAPNEAPGITFLRGDVHTAPIQETFDVITGLTVIEHLQHPDVFVARLAQLLRPGGRIILTTDNTGGLLYSTARVLRRCGIRSAYERLYDEHHLHHFTNQSFRKLLERHGFDVVVQRNHNYPLKAVDAPLQGPVMEALYLAAVATMFAASTVLRNGILQTAVCQKTPV